LLASVLLSVFEPSGARAEALRLVAAIDRAIEKSPLLEAARHERRRADAGVDRARAGFLPRLEGSYGYARGDQPVYAFGSKLNQGRFTEDDFDVQRLNDPDALDNFRAAITLYQPVYTGGKATLGLERARLGSRIAELEASRAIQEVVFQVARGYFGLRLAQERLVAVEAAVRAAEANLDLARSRFRAGLAVESDVLAAEVRAARLREEALTARSQVSVGQAALNDAMGTPLDTPIDAVDALLPHLDSKDDGPETALASRPDYQALRLQSDVWEQEIGLARAEFLPNIGLEGTYEVNNANPASDGQGSWSVGAVLRWNFLAGGGDRARVREAEAARDRARSMLARAANQVELEVRDARARLDTARERVALAERALAQAEEALRIVRVRYRGGLTTIVDLLALEAAATEARLRRTQALHDHNLGRAAWRLALGRLDRAAFE
jgi:TolC family type I secretion outer membrane protein